MQYYTKINSLFKRHLNEDDPLKGLIIPGEFAQEEFSLLADKKWLTTEKIDGTNMSYHFHYETAPIKVDAPVEDYFEVHGKTPDSKIPIPLLTKMQNMLSKEDFHRVFLKEDTTFIDVFIFGEGYGRKIQKYGNRYINDDVDFIVFDVKINGIWLERESVEDICHKLNLKCVPYLGYMTLFDAVEMVKKGFKSFVSEDKNLDAEGLVLTAPLMLRDRLGNRIITKIKTCDFTKLNVKLNQK